MGEHAQLEFKIASEPWEFERIHRLNYETFVEEIPQHEPNPSQQLVDKFHDENTYVIALIGRQLVGMVAFRSRRPFSLDHKAYSALPISHRAERFLTDMAHTRLALCSLVRARHTEILVGSGTLANDVIAGQLSLEGTPGLVLVNGEFGERLVDHARRSRLPFQVHAVEWGSVFEPDAIEAALDRAAPVDWLWAVHCETSTGILNDLDALKAICSRRGVKLCMDCISSIGTVPVDLTGVYLASGVSGKAVRALPGLGLVFHDHEVKPAEPPASPGEPSRPTLPRYLDLGLYAAHDGVPFTHSSNLLYALQAAVSQMLQAKPFGEILELSQWLRPRLRAMGFHILAPDEHAAPAVITLVLPPTLQSGELGEEMDRAGHLLSYRSGYLLERNWVQIALMGEVQREQLEALLAALGSACELS